MQESAWDAREAVSDFPVGSGSERGRQRARRARYTGNGGSAPHSLPRQGLMPIAWGAGMLAGAL
jgi:hypothetical protein